MARKRTGGNQAGTRADARVDQSLERVHLDAAGIGPLAARKPIAEVCTDMPRRQTEKHYTAWLTLAPRNKISDGKRCGHPAVGRPDRSGPAHSGDVNSRRDNALAAWPSASAPPSRSPRPPASSQRSSAPCPRRTPESTDRRHRPQKKASRGAWIRAPACTARQRARGAGLFGESSP